METQCSGVHILLAMQRNSKVSEINSKEERLKGNTDNLNRNTCQVQQKKVKVRSWLSRLQVFRFTSSLGLVSSLNYSPYAESASNIWLTAVSLFGQNASFTSTISPQHVLARGALSQASLLRGYCEMWPSKQETKSLTGCMNPSLKHGINSIPGFRGPASPFELI